MSHQISNLKLTLHLISYAKISHLQKSNQISNFKLTLHLISYTKIIHLQKSNAKGLLLESM